MIKRYSVLLLFCLPVLAWAKVPVVASFSILGDMTKEIGGDRIALTTLVGPDQDAHVFQPSPADVKKISAAKVLVINGLGLEGWMTRLGKSANFKGVQVVATAGIKAREMDEHDEHDHAHADHGHEQDPHAWHDPKLAEVYIRNIAAGLIKADPAGKAEYKKRAAAYVQQLQNLDKWAMQAFKGIPAGKRKLLTSHDAFGYLGARYQIKILYLQGLSTESEASAKRVAQMITQVKKEKVRAIFMENMTDARLLRQVAKEAKVDISGKLYSDALSNASGPASTYLKMVKYNVQTIVSSMK